MPSSRYTELRQSYIYETVEISQIPIALWTDIISPLNGYGQYGRINFTDSGLQYMINTYYPEVDIDVVRPLIRARLENEGFTLIDMPNNDGYYICWDV